MTISGREKAFAAITVLVVMYGILGLLARGRIDTWKARNEEYRSKTRKLETERRMIAQRPLWERNYAGVRDLMLVVPTNKPMDTHWARVMDEAAGNNQIKILKRQAAPEKLAGDVYEMAITCQEWEGTLDSVVRFLYELESTGVMLDMRQMFIRPNPADHSRLKGSFTLYCAYMREKPAAKSPPGSPATRTPAAPPAASKPVAAVRTNRVAATQAPAAGRPNPGVPPAPATRPDAAPAAPSAAGTAEDSGEDPADEGTAPVRRPSRGRRAPR